MNKCLETILALGLTAGITGCDTRAMKVTIEKPQPTKPVPGPASYTTGPTRAEAGMPEPADIATTATEAKPSIKPSWQMTPEERYAYQLKLRSEIEARVYGGSGSHGDHRSTPALSPSCSETDDVYERAFQLLKSGKEGYSLKMSRDCTGEIVSGKCIFVASHPKTYGTLDNVPSRDTSPEPRGYFSVEFWTGYLGERKLFVELSAFERLQRKSLEFELKNKNTMPVAAIYEILDRAAGCDDTVTVDELEAVCR